MGTILKQSIIMDMWYHDKDETLSPNPKATPVFRNIRIRNVTCREADEAILLKGLPESPIQDVIFENVTIHARKDVTEIRTRDIVKKNVKIVVEK